jgi:hypothetical protein
LSTKKAVFIMNYKENLNIYLMIYAELSYSIGSFKLRHWKKGNLVWEVEKRGKAGQQKSNIYKK